jgi:hypothetical protein
MLSPSYRKHLAQALLPHLTTLILLAMLSNRSKEMFLQLPRLQLPGHLVR